MKQPDKEMLETLTILDPEEAFLLPIDNALAYAYGESLTLDFNARLARSTIAKKGKGREDAKTMVGAVKQSISIPTVLSKVREKLTGGKKEEEVESNQLQ